MVVIKLSNKTEEKFLKQNGDGYITVDFKSEATKYENFLVALCVVKEFDLGDYAIKITEV